MSDDAEIPPTTEPLDEAGSRALVEAWCVSGLSGAAFCRQHNLRAQRLHYWREQLGYPIKVVSEPSCAPVARPPTTDGFVRMVVRAQPVPPSIHVDIVVGGAIIWLEPGFDAALLRGVVGALALSHRRARLVTFLQIRLAASFERRTIHLVRPRARTGSEPRDRSSPRRPCQCSNTDRA